MQKMCTQCSAPFEITQDDLAFYDKVSPVFNGKKELIPPPTLCPACRQQRRLCWRNERNLYHRTCSATGKKMISNYSEDKPYPVVEPAYWFSDKWDTRKFGRDFDFTKTFAENFRDLQNVVPRFMVQQQATMENSAYCNFASNCKDCYLIFDSDFCQDSLYGNVLKHSKDCIDCSFLTECDVCYECIDCKHCYNLQYSRDCDNCSDSLFLKSCVGCRNCAFSINLRQAEYVFANKQLTRDQYADALATMGTGSYMALMQYQKDFPHYCSTQIHKYLQGNNNENVSGDHIYNSKNIHQSFNIDDCWDIAYSEILYQAQSCMDVSSFGEKIEHIYESTTIGLGTQSCAFCFTSVVNSSSLLYCDISYASKNCFGCAGLHRNEYCILNKQYTKEECETLVLRIIAHMRETEEWGEFFPHHLSPFGYNETVAMDFFPLTESTIRAKGWNWHSEEPAHGMKYMGPSVTLPDRSEDSDATITSAILLCEATGKEYKITPKELAFYREHHIPIPHLCPDERHRRRMSLKSQRVLHRRVCAQCSKSLETTFALERPEIIYCEDCYLASVY